MRTIKFIIILLLPSTMWAQSKIINEKGEKWWYQPISEFGDLTNVKDSCARASAFVSSTGRYIYNGNELSYCISNGAIEISGSNITPTKQGRTLRDATLMLSHRVGPREDIKPTTTYIANCNANTLERFIELKDIIAKERGDIIIKSWNNRSGELEFIDSRMEIFVLLLKEAGFRVILEVNPLLSADTPAAMEAIESGDVVMIDDTTPLLVKHSKGYSLLYDLTKDSSLEHFNSKLKSFKDKYQFDGYYFNLDRVEPYMGEPIFYNQTTMSRLGSYYAQKIDDLLISNIVTSSEAVVFKPYSSKIVEETIQEEITAIYGGEKQLVVDSDNSDMLLYLSRIFIPRREITITDSFERDLNLYKEAEALRENIMEHIQKVVVEEKSTGAPAIRAMEYEFPGKGFSNCIDQYMLGSGFIIAPHTGDGSRMVRLPTGRWKDSNGVIIKGPAVISAPKSDLIPYYERIKK